MKGGETMTDKERILDALDWMGERQLRVLWRSIRLHFGVFDPYVREKIAQERKNNEGR